MTTRSVPLDDGEREVTLSALHAYRFETTQYLRHDDMVGATHDDCCSAEQARKALRQAHRNNLNDRLRNIDGAIMELEAVEHS